LRARLEAERVARIVESQHLPMNGGIEEPALLRRGSERIETITTLRPAA
jgi:hypothetical protein